jgi:hypothetical protein
MEQGEIQLAGSSGQQAEPRGQKSEVRDQKTDDNRQCCYPLLVIREFCPFEP